jgi:hypothetical protein
MSILEDGERMLWVNNGTSMVSPRQLRTIFGRLTLSISNLTVDLQTSDVLLLTLDGGNCLDTKVRPLSMKEEKF